MRRLSRGRLPIMLGALFLLLLLAGCAQGLKPGNPLLPEGFEEAQIPDVEIMGYVFVSQGQPFVLPNRLFVDSGTALPPEAPESSTVNRLSLWVGPSVTLFGNRMDFTSGTAATFAAEHLREQEQAGLWVHQAAGQVTLGRGEGEWSQQLRQAVQSQTYTALQTKLPDVWETIRMLPEQPPGKPVAVGFLKVQDGLIDYVAQKADLNVGTLSQAMEMVRISNVAFAVYSEEPLELPERIDKEYLQQSRLGAVFVAPSGYPGFILSFLFGNFADRAGMESVDLDQGTTANHLKMEELHLLVKNVGSTIVFSLAPDQPWAEALLLNALQQ